MNKQYFFIDAKYFVTKNGQNFKDVNTETGPLTFMDAVRQLIEWIKLHPNYVIGESYDMDDNSRCVIICRDATVAEPYLSARIEERW